VRTSAQLLASDELESRPAQLLTALTAKWLGAGTIYRDAATVYGDGAGSTLNQGDSALSSSGHGMHGQDN